MSYYVTCSHSSKHCCLTAFWGAMHTQRLLQMDPIHRRPVKQRELSVLNQKEEREFRYKLDVLEKQFRYKQKMLKQRRESLIREHRKVVTVKVCEPKATVNIAMREIDQQMSVEAHFRGIHTSDGRRLRPGKGSEIAEQNRSTSAPPPAAESANVVRHRCNIQNNLSLLQIRNIATIDSISEKELARQQQKAREEMERMRQRQMEDLHKRVAAFIERFQVKETMRTQVEPP